MAPLPKTIVGTKMRAFAKYCVDYAGPFTTKITRRVSAERYLCLFTCSATRAVHLEMACSLSTTDFLNAFSQMVATRGRPEEVTSDYGTDFVGAERESSENLFKQWTRNRSPVMLPITGSDGIGILRWGRFLVGCLSRCLKELRKLWKAVLFAVFSLLELLPTISMRYPANRSWEYSNVSGTSWYLDLKPNSRNLYTRKCLAARGEN